MIYQGIERAKGRRTDEMIVKARQKDRSEKGRRSGKGRTKRE